MRQCIWTVDMAIVALITWDAFNPGRSIHTSDDLSRGRRRNHHCCEGTPSIAGKETKSLGSSEIWWWMDFIIPEACLNSMMCCMASIRHMAFGPCQPEIISHYGMSHTVLRALVGIPEPESSRGNPHLLTENQN